MKLVGYQIFLRITRFVTLVIRPDYQKCCLRATPDEIPTVARYNDRKGEMREKDRS